MNEDLELLAARLRLADAHLRYASGNQRTDEERRLGGKSEGVRLALSYVEEMLREGHRWDRTGAGVK